MTTPTIVDLPPELLEAQQRWLALGQERNGRVQQDALYASEFAAPFARLFAQLPLHGAPAGLERPRALVSVLGFSWQPVALMAAWARPERLLVLGSDDSLKVKIGEEGVLSIVARVAGISRDVIESVRVGDPGEEDIYRAVRDFLRRSEIPPRQVFVDPTGGKKSMSASAALAGFLAGAPLVYVDYDRYDGPNRIPVAGAEYPRLLRNPLEVLGDLEMRDIFGAFNRSDFQEAERLAKRLVERLYEPREAECLMKLARGYGAWDRFDFLGARQALVEARVALDRFDGQRAWVWGGAADEVLDGNLRALDALAQIQKQPNHLNDGAPLLVWYLAAARRLLDTGKPSLAVLLTYAAVERYVDLCLWIDFRLDDEAPDYAYVEARLVRAKYDEAGRWLFGKDYKSRDLDGPLMFANGAQLLAALAPERLALNELGPLKGLASARNKCEYEHGFLPKTPRQDDVKQYLARATEVIARACGGKDALERKLHEFEFPKLPDQASES
jgi:CRISPR-associated protein (TIGR02710 family)